jgi:Histidine-specific methyltransferase, SAM-dependent
MNKNSVSLRSVSTVDGKKLVDLAESANLYLTAKQGGLYQKAIRQSPDYNSHILQPLYQAEVELPWLLNIARDFGDRDLTLVDCGPGTVEDGRLHIDMLAKFSRNLSYIIIDVNASLLDTVLRGLPSIGSVVTIDKRFEDLERSHLEISDRSDALFIFGSTAMNFDLLYFKSILDRLTRPGDLVALQAVLCDDLDFVKHVDRYITQPIIDFTFGPLELLGARIDQFCPEFRWSDNRIEFRFRALDKMLLLHPECRELDVGDIVLTGFSRRPSRIDYELEMKRLFRHAATRVSAGGVAISVGVI